MISMALRANSMFPLVKISTTQIVQWAVYGVPFLMAPTFMVLMLKRQLSKCESAWPMVTPVNDIYRRFKDRPWHVYLFVSICGYLSALVTLVLLNAVFGMLSHQESSGGFDTLSRMAIWPFLGMVTAAFVAFRIDSRSNGNRSESLKALLTAAGCLLQAMATVVTIYFAFMHCNNGGNLSFTSQLTMADQTRLFIYLVMGVCIGMALFLTSRFSTADLDRREVPRKKVNKATVLVVGDIRINGVLKDYSESGAYIKVDHTPQGMDVNRIIQVIIEDGQPITAKIINVIADDIRMQFVAEEEREDT